MPRKVFVSYRHTQARFVRDRLLPVLEAGGAAAGGIRSVMLLFGAAFTRLGVSRPAVYGWCMQPLRVLQPVSRASARPADVCMLRYFWRTTLERPRPEKARHSPRCRSSSPTVCTATALDATLLQSTVQCPTLPCLTPGLHSTESWKPPQRVIWDRPEKEPTGLAKRPAPG